MTSDKLQLTSAIFIVRKGENQLNISWHDSDILEKGKFRVMVVDGSGVRKGYYTNYAASKANAFLFARGFWKMILGF